METIAHNVANAGTVGYRAEEIRFETLLARAGDKKVAFTSPGESFVQTNSGAMVKTGNPLDVAVAGDGWLGLQSPQGIIYTRDGRMVMAESGNLQSVNGYGVLDAGGAALLLDATAGPPTISRDGMITQSGRQVGAVGLFKLEPNSKLTRTDNSGVQSDKPASPVLDFTSSGVIQGFTEAANVNPVMEMTRMMNIQRTFDGIASAMDASESTYVDAIKTLGASA